MWKGIYSIPLSNKILMEQDGAACCCILLRPITILYVGGICSPCRLQIHGYDFSSSHPQMAFRNHPHVMSRFTLPKFFTARFMNEKLPGPKTLLEAGLLSPSISQIQLYGV